MDKRGKLFGKVNIIDALVVLLLIGLAAAVIFRFTADGMVRDADTRVRYTVMAEGVRYFTLEYYAVGLRCFDRRQQQYIGNIVDVRYEPFKEALQLFDGTIIMAERPGHLRVFIDVEAYARITDSAILINGAYELRVGSRIRLNTKYLDVYVTVVDAVILD